MIKFQNAKIVDDLRSTDYIVQVSAMEMAASACRVLGEAAAYALLNSENPFLLAERIIGLGTVVVEPLENSLSATPDEKITDVPPKNRTFLN